LSLKFNEGSFKLIEGSFKVIGRSFRFIEGSIKAKVRRAVKAEKPKNTPLFFLIFVL